MIKKAKDMENKTISNMRGGDGDALSTLLLDSTDMGNHLRIFSNFTLKKGCSIGEHTHNGETEYYFILSGTGIVSEKDGEKVVSSGDLVITGNGESHAIRNDEEEDLVFVAIVVLD